MSEEKSSAWRDCQRDKRAGKAVAELATAGRGKRLRHSVDGFLLDLVIRQEQDTKKTPRPGTRPRGRGKAFPPLTPPLPAYYYPQVTRLEGW
ncbi:MAG: hypothetical protein GY832_45390 [Chloroflexi bacterium]|nr:hypothetical protein [Chloroflexota bacterium]